jgi:hypothetical protein
LSKINCSLCLGLEPHATALLAPVVVGRKIHG